MSPAKPNLRIRPRLTREIRKEYAEMRALEERRNKIVEAIEERARQQPPLPGFEEDAQRIVDERISARTKPFERKINESASNLSLLTSALSAIEKYSTQATTDALTGLSNANGREKAITIVHSLANRNNWPVATLFFDGNNFGKVNKKLGHDVGDKVIKSLAAAVKKNTRPYDHVSRYGGDEFVAILPNAKTEHAKKIGERVRQDFLKRIDGIPGIKELEIDVAYGARHQEKHTRQSIIEMIIEADRLMTAEKRRMKGL